MSTCCFVNYQDLLCLSFALSIGHQIKSHSLLAVKSSFDFPFTWSWPGILRVFFHQICTALWGFFFPSPLCPELPFLVLDMCFFSGASDTHRQSYADGSWWAQVWCWKGASLPGNTGSEVWNTQHNGGSPLEGPWRSGGWVSDLGARVSRTQEVKWNEFCV